MANKSNKRQFDENKVAACHDDLLKIFQKYKLTVPEIIVAYGNLGYSLGASIEGFKGTGPSPQEVTKMYYANPGRIGNALMAQGILITTWYDNLLKQAAEEDKQNQTKTQE